MIYQTTSRCALVRVQLRSRGMIAHSWVRELIRAYDAPLSGRDTNGGTEPLASTLKPRRWHTASKVSNMQKDRCWCKVVRRKQALWNYKKGLLAGGLLQDAKQDNP